MPGLHGLIYLICIFKLGIQPIKYFKTKTISCDFAVKILAINTGICKWKINILQVFLKTTIMAQVNPFEFSDDSDLSDISEGEEAFIVSHLTDEEKEQYEYIRSQIVISTARGKRLKSFMDRVLNVTAQSNPGIPKEYAEHLMRDMTKISEDVFGEGKSSSTIPDDPDTPLIIKILPSSLKLKKMLRQLKKRMKKSKKKQKQ